MSYRITNTGFSINDNPCADKVSFMTKEQAEAARVQANWEHDNKDLGVYLCQKCNLHHLATSHQDSDE